MPWFGLGRRLWRGLAREAHQGGKAPGPASFTRCPWLNAPNGLQPPAKRRAMTGAMARDDPPLIVHVFLSSPGDVPEERAAARDLLKAELPHNAKLPIQSTSYPARS